MVLFSGIMCGFGAKFKLGSDWASSQAIVNSEINAMSSLL